MPSLPSPVRAALGLAVTVLDEAKHLPDKAIELPMLAVSRALQLSLRAQQRYTALAARGDELLAARSVKDDAPSWATFDEPVAASGRGGGPDADPVAEILDEPVDTAAEAPSGSPAELSDELSESRRPAPRPRPAKTVRAPRTGATSAFDAVGDDD